MIYYIHKCLIYIFNHGDQTCKSTRGLGQVYSYKLTRKIRFSSNSIVSSGVCEKIKKKNSVPFLEIQAL